MKNPLISVCIQTYQHAPYIEQCLDCILRQETTFQYEVLIGEDESTDGTRELCIAYAERYPEQIRLFLRSRKDVIYINNRPTGRFNLVENLGAARGKYIAFCEGDDYWTDPRKLQKQIDFLESHPDYVLCSHRSDILNTDGTLRLHPIPYEQDFYTGYDLIKTHNFITTASAVFRNLPVWEVPNFKKVPFADLYLWLSLAEHGKIKMLEDKMSCYRIHNAGSWSGLKEQEKNNTYIHVLELIKNDFGKKYYAACELIITQLKRKNRALKLQTQLPLLSKVLNKFTYWFRRYA